MNNECMVCGHVLESPSALKDHLRNVHNVSMPEYRAEYGIPRIASNRIYKNLSLTVPCHICGKTFEVSSAWHAMRLRDGKNRFACPSSVKGKRSDCCKALQAITIKEIRSTPESKAKTRLQMLERWKTPGWRKNFRDKIEAKGPKWHTKRMAAALKTCLSCKQTKPEKKVEDYIKSHNLPFKFTGNGTFSVGKLFPDFVATDGRKLLIDVHGCYWHGCQQCFPGSKGKGIAFNQRAIAYKKHGYAVITIWEHELADSAWQSKLA